VQALDIIPYNQQHENGGTTVYLLRTGRPRLVLLGFVHFKCNGNNEVDASGERSLGLLVSRLHAAGYAVTFSGLKLQVMDVLKETGLDKEIGVDNIFPTLAGAIEVIRQRVLHDGSLKKRIMPCRHDPLAFRVLCRESEQFGVDKEMGKD